MDGFKSFIRRFWAPIVALGSVAVAFGAPSGIVDAVTTVLSAISGSSS